MGRTAPPAGVSICISPITFSPVHGTVFYPIYHTERWLLRSTSRANALTIQNFPTSVQELSPELTVLTFKLSNQVTLQQPVDTTAISRTPSLGLSSRQDYVHVLFREILLLGILKIQKSNSRNSNRIHEIQIKSNLSTKHKVTVSLEKFPRQRLREDIACCSSLGTCLIANTPSSVKLLRKWCLMSMCLLLPELSGFSASAIAPSLSSST